MKAERLLDDRGMSSVTRSGSKGRSDTHATITESTTEASSTSTSGKTGVGKIGVHLRWHKAKDFVELSEVQRCGLT